MIKNQPRLHHSIFVENMQTQGWKFFDVTNDKRPDYVKQLTAHKGD